ncbi:hypothetical protein [Streptomyces sp. NPDC021622]|uniref:hypothetical protein n=1 Tax=Streptomyces sp. NPDC021622 TaxID=3155013 RepID=UPI0033DAE05B
MMPDEDKIPPGPVGTQGLPLNPSELKIGDLLHFDGTFFPIRDMVTGRGGSRVLNFLGRDPYTVSGPTLIYRVIELNARQGALHYIRTEAP